MEEDINGTGPYCFYSISDTELKLTKNDDWWYSSSYFDKVVFKIYNEDEMLDAFQDNKVDITFVKMLIFLNISTELILIIGCFRQEKLTFLCESK